MSVGEAESICSGVRTSMKLNSIPIEGAARLETVDCCFMVCGGGIPENRDPGNARHRVFKQFQSLRTKLSEHNRQPHGVSARARQARNQATTEWIGDDGLHAQTLRTNGR